MIIIACKFIAPRLVTMPSLERVIAGSTPAVTAKIYQTDILKIKVWQKYATGTTIPIAKNEGHTRR